MKTPLRPWLTWFRLASFAWLATSTPLLADLPLVSSLDGAMHSGGGFGVTNVPAPYSPPVKIVSQVAGDYSVRSSGQVIIESAAPAAAPAAPVGGQAVRSSGQVIINATSSTAPAAGNAAPTAFGSSAPAIENALAQPSGKAILDTAAKTTVRNAANTAVANGGKAALAGEVAGGVAKGLVLTYGFFFAVGAAESLYESEGLEIAEEGRGEILDDRLCKVVTKNAWKLMSDAYLEVKKQKFSSYEDCEAAAAIVRNHMESFLHAENEHCDDSGFIKDNAARRTILAGIMADLTCTERDGR